MVSKHIKHILSTPYKPSSIRVIESVNRTIYSLLASFSSERSRWDQTLASAIVTYNHTMHCVGKKSPAEYLLSKPHMVSTSPSFLNEVTQNWKAGHPGFSHFKV